MICLSIAQSFMLAYLLYVSFEAPSVNLLKLLMAKKQKTMVVNKVTEKEKVQACTGGDAIDENNNNNNNNNNNDKNLKDDADLTKSSSSKKNE